jgi:hypothetical protein
MPVLDTMLARYLEDGNASRSIAGDGNSQSRLNLLLRNPQIKRSLAPTRRASSSAISKYAPSNASLNLERENTFTSIIGINETSKIHDAKRRIRKAFLECYRGIRLLQSYKVRHLWLLSFGIAYDLVV